MAHMDGLVPVDDMKLARRRISHSACMKAKREDTDNAGNALLDILPPSYVELYRDLATTPLNGFTRQSSIIEAALSYIEVLRERRDGVKQHRVARNNMTPSGLLSKNKTSNAKSVQNVYELNRALVGAMDPYYQQQVRNEKGEAVCRSFVAAREFILALEVDVAEKLEHQRVQRALEVAHIARLEREWELETAAALAEEEHYERQWWAFWPDAWREEEENGEKERKWVEEREKIEEYAVTTFKYAASVALD